MCSDPVHGSIPRPAETPASQRRSRAVPQERGVAPAGTRSGPRRLLRIPQMFRPRAVKHLKRGRKPTRESREVGRSREKSRNLKKSPERPTIEQERTAAVRSARAMEVGAPIAPSMPCCTRRVSELSLVTSCRRQSAVEVEVLPTSAGRARDDVADRPADRGRSRRQSCQSELHREREDRGQLLGRQRLRMLVLVNRCDGVAAKLVLDAEMSLRARILYRRRRRRDHVLRGVEHDRLRLPLVLAELLERLRRCLFDRGGLDRPALDQALAAVRGEGDAIRPGPRDVAAAAQASRFRLRLDRFRPLRGTKALPLRTDLRRAHQPRRRSLPQGVEPRAGSRLFRDGSESGSTLKRSSTHRK